MSRPSAQPRDGNRCDLAQADKCCLEDDTHLVLVTFWRRTLLPTMSARKGPPNARNGWRRMKGSRPAALGD